MTEQAFILIVDDTPTNLKVLFDVLESANFRTLIAKSGEDAIEKLAVIQPDLILLDVMMPGIDGFETCRRIKFNSKTGEIPIIFMTALSDVEEKVKGLSAGAVDYITKPFQQKEVLARVRIHLQLSRQTAQLKTLTETLEQRVEERTAQLSESIAQLQQTQLQLIQSEKMSALGQLVAGIGHEVSNPLSAILGNLLHTENYVQDLLQHLQVYQACYPNPAEAIAQSAEAIDLVFLCDDLPKLIQAMHSAAARLKDISTSLRLFSRRDAECLQPFDLHEGIDSTLLILGHRLRSHGSDHEIQVIKNYGELPLVKCYPGQINQVFMNLLANAIDALEETRSQAAQSCITVATELSDRQTSLIHIQDNGIGISEAMQQRIFKADFTTKAAGKGTGLGLAIAQQIVVEKHGGLIHCVSRLGEGTRFTIELPLEPADGQERLDLNAPVAGRGTLW